MMDAAEAEASGLTHLLESQQETPMRKRPVLEMAMCFDLGRVKRELLLRMFQIVRIVGRGDRNSSLLTLPFSCQLITLLFVFFHFRISSNHVS